MDHVEPSIRNKSIARKKRSTMSQSMDKKKLEPWKNLKNRLKTTANR